MGNCITFIGTNTNEGVDVDIVELQSIMDIVDKYCKNKREDIKILRKTVPICIDKYIWKNGKCTNIICENSSPIEELFELEEIESVRLSNDDNKIYKSLCEEQKNCIRKSQEIVFTFDDNSH